MTTINAAVAAHPMPLRMVQRPVSAKGWPVPWFVTERTDDGDWDFRATDPDRVAQAIGGRRCWVCGDRLGAHLCFAIGPMCAINRTTSEPAVHRECGEWSVKVCPFMVSPRARRNKKGLPEDVARGDYVAGNMIERNPGVIALWMTRSFHVIRAHGILIRLGEPEEVSWWSEGRPATRAEVDHSVSTGMPFLEAEARSPADKRALAAYVLRAQPLFEAIPA